MNRNFPACAFPLSKDDNIRTPIPNPLPPTIDRKAAVTSVTAPYTRHQGAKATADSKTRSVICAKIIINIVNREQYTDKLLVPPK